VAQYASQLKGIHSDHTLLSQIPYIDDVNYELQLMEQERANTINLDLFGVTDTPSTDNGTTDTTSTENTTTATQG
jgi:hypothetical protein